MYPHIENKKYKKWNKIRLLSWEWASIKCLSGNSEAKKLKHLD